MYLGNCTYSTTGTGFIDGLNCPDVEIIVSPPTYSGSTTSQLFFYQDTDGGYYINYSLIFTVLAWFWAFFFISLIIYGIISKGLKLGLKK